MNNWFPLIALLILIPSYLATIFIPYWTRRTESFGVTIPEEVYHSPLLKRLRKKYVQSTSLLALLLTLLFLFLSMGADEAQATILLTITILFYFIVTAIIYLIFHKRMKKIKAASAWSADETQEVVISTAFRKEKLTYSNLWFLISLFLTVGLIIYSIINYHLLPDQIPMQYSFSGEVTRSAEKSYLSILMVPAFQFFLIGVFIFSNSMIQLAKQQIDQSNPKLSLKRNSIFRKRWSLFLIITGNGIIALLTFVQIAMFHPVNKKLVVTISLIFNIAIIIYAIYLSFKLGQGGSRLYHVTGPGDTQINRDDDRYWKLGVFYFNKEDPAVFLEKRFGIGWTINMARPHGWIILIIILGLAFLIPVLLS